MTLMENIQLPNKLTDQQINTSCSMYVLKKKNYLSSKK